MKPVFESGTLPLFIEYASEKLPYEMPAMHYHDTYELYFLENGRRNYIINDKFFELSKMDVALIPPKSLHKTGGSGYDRILINFSAEYLNKYFSHDAVLILLSCFEKQIISLPKDKFERTKYYLGKLYKADDNLHFVYLANILTILNSCMKYENAEKRALSQMDKKISAILDYINKNYPYIENISQIADEFYITKFHLCRVFKKAAGVSLIEYLSSVRIKNACALLLETDKTITQISILCGFNTPMYFCRLFKKLTSLTPSQYRKVNR